MSETIAGGEVMTVAVIGGAGRVGFGMCMVLADAGHQVYGIDIDAEACRRIMNGELPFSESQGEAYLQRALSSRRLVMTTEFCHIAEADVIILVVGTPIDEHFNPNLQPLSQAIGSVNSYLKPGHLLILRSTVSPGTTDRVKTLIEQQTGLAVGKELFLVFAPERVVQGQAIREIVQIPQLIGSFDDASYERAEAFFKTFLQTRCFKLTPVEAEIGKLMTNMTRYVQFALANEYYLIADLFGANIHKVIDACTYEYPRLHLPTPGPNVGGPCLSKDGYFLLERLPFPELISVAFKINESMPAYLVRKLEQLPGIARVAILGMAFKADNDDTRNSLSFKLKKQLENANYDVVCVDPNVQGQAGLPALAGMECVMVMSPHQQFRSLESIVNAVGNDACVYIDLWGLWAEMKYRSRNGLFTGSEARRCLAEPVQEPVTVEE